MSSYQPTVIPRRKWSERWEWFDMIKDMNRVSVQNRSKWQEKSVKTVSGWAVKAPNGYFLPSTFSVSRAMAKKKCMEEAFRKFNGMTSSLFSEWKRVGYKLVKVEWVEK